MLTTMPQNNSGSGQVSATSTRRINGILTEEVTISANQAAVSAPNSENNSGETHPE